MILNIQRGREWIAEKLGREGTVSITTWSKLVSQGLPCATTITPVHQRQLHQGVWGSAGPGVS